MADEFSTSEESLMTLLGDGASLNTPRDRGSLWAMLAMITTKQDFMFRALNEWKAEEKAWRETIEARLSALETKGTELGVVWSVILTVAGAAWSLALVWVGMKFGG
ncbi:hypothetical protein [Aestuariivirga sp.]|uniref:hypothetical protein n=1 Tax=Aestuariivirga sp. TaxID=2650926 RepID=UPI0039E4F90D